MAAFIANYTFDGVTDVDLQSYFTDLDWNDGFAGWVSLFAGNPDDRHDITIDFTGSDWFLQTLRFVGDATMDLTLRDVGGGGNRTIDVLQLEDNAIVDFGTTRVEHLMARNGDYDITLGGGNTQYIRMTGDGDKSLTLESGMTASMVWLDGGTVDLDLQDDARIFSLKIDNAVASVTTGTGFLESYFAFASQSLLRIGDGGVGQILLAGDGGVQRVIADGFVGSVQVFDDNRLIGVFEDYVGAVQSSTGNDFLSIGGGAGSLATRDGNDVVVVREGFIDSIALGNGDDRVFWGPDGVGITRGQSGDDKFIVGPLNPGGGGAIWGGSGTDELFLGRFLAQGIELSLADTGFQALGGGSISVQSIENIITANGNDTIIGNDADNYINLKGGKDLAHGGAGDDTIVGEGGSDTLFGGEGNDRLVGGAAVDFLNGEEGNDVLIGGEGSDRFIFTVDSGTDTVRDFTLNATEADRLVLDQGLWGETLTAQEVVDTYAYVAGNGAVVFDFGPEGRLILTDFGTLTGLAGQIDFL